VGKDPITAFLRDPKSKSRQLLARFIEEFITRYAHRKTIFFYELTNEMNLVADVDLSGKCQKSRTQSCVWSNFTTADMIEFSRQLVVLIKRLDPSRKVTSGYAIPRPSAAHLMRRPAFAPGGPDWTLDTREEFDQYLLAIHAPFDIVSVHIYPAPGERRFGQNPGDEYDLVANAEAVAKRAAKPLFIGEFGDSGRTPFMTHLLEQIVRDHVDYAAIWTWEFYQTATYRTHDTEPTKFSVEPGYSDDVISLLMDIERKMGMGPPQAAANAPPRVVLTWPVPCAVVDKPIDLNAVASEGAKSVQRVEFLVDGKLVGSALTPPYSVHFSPIGLGDRLATIEAKATGYSGASAAFDSKVRLNGSNNLCN
jgi:hypothetical protein